MFALYLSYTPKHSLSPREHALTRVWPHDKYRTPILNAKPDSTSTLFKVASSSNQKRKRTGLDYLLLNDGIEGDDILTDNDVNEIHEDRDELTDDVSQVTRPDEGAHENKPEEPENQPHSSASVAKQHSWLWEYFEVMHLQDVCTPLMLTSGRALAPHLFCLAFCSASIW